MQHKSAQGSSHTCSKRREREAHCSSDNNFTSSNVTLFIVRVGEQIQSNQHFVSLLGHLYSWVHDTSLLSTKRDYVNSCQPMIKKKGESYEGPVKGLRAESSTGAEWREEIMTLLCLSVPSTSEVNTVHCWHQKEEYRWQQRARPDQGQSPSLGLVTYTGRLDLSSSWSLYPQQKSLVSKLNTQENRS